MRLLQFHSGLKVKTHLGAPIFVLQKFSARKSVTIYSIKLWDLPWGDLSIENGEKGILGGGDYFPSNFSPLNMEHAKNSLNAHKVAQIWYNDSFCSILKLLCQELLIYNPLLIIKVLRKLSIHYSESLHSSETRWVLTCPEAFLTNIRSRNESWRFVSKKIVQICSIF